jgi:hypothetical protein
MPQLIYIPDPQLVTTLAFDQGVRLLKPWAAPENLAAREKQRRFYT